MKMIASVLQAAHTHIRTSVQFLCLTTLVFLSVSDSLFSQEPVTIDTLGNNRATAYPMQNKIISSDIDGVRKTFIAYGKNTAIDSFAAWQSMSVWVATFDHLTQAIESKTLVGYLRDNHGSPALTIDRDGYLHIVYGAAFTPVRYRKALEPNSAASWSPEERISSVHGHLDSSDVYLWDDYSTRMSEGEMTYPIIKTDSRNNIHIVGSLRFATGYLGKIDGEWRAPQIVYTATKSLSRYDVMMNIIDDEIHILAPDLEYIPNEDGLKRGDLEYHHYVSSNYGDTFNYNGLAFSAADGYGYGIGNISFDMDKVPHFLVVKRDWAQKKGFWYNSFDGVAWQSTYIDIPGKHVWLAKMVHHGSDPIIALQVNETVADWGDSTNQIQLVRLRKEQQDYSLDKVVDLTEISTGTAVLNWLPVLEENETYSDFSPDAVNVVWTSDPDRGEMELDSIPEPSLQNLLKTKVNLFSFSIAALFDATTHVAAKDNAAPSDMILASAYPNPFNAQLSIKYESEAGLAENVTIGVYNIRGELVQTLQDGHVSAGINAVTWDASNYSTGYYFIRLSNRNTSRTLPVTLIK